jgi:hypothetical protein
MLNIQSSNPKRYKYHYEGIDLPKKNMFEIKNTKLINTMDIQSRIEKIP